MPRFSVLTRVAGVAVAATLASACRDPTQITVEITTDFPCADAHGAAISTGQLAELADKPPSASTPDCANQRVGSIVVVPSGGKDDEVAVQVVMGFQGAVEECQPPAYGDHCIVARRAMRFIPHTPLTVPITMRAECAGVTCEPNQTCVKGTCFSAEVDSALCDRGSGCDEEVLFGEGDASPRDGGLPDSSTGADASMDAGPDVSMDAAADVSTDVGADAPLADAPGDVGPDAPADAGSDSPPPLDAGGGVRAIFPWNGYYTGSVHAPGGLGSPTRPRFFWTTDAQYNSYELEVDDSCSLASFKSCSFPSPESTVAVSGGSTHSGALPVASTGQPVGTRYYWRVRGCLGASPCGPWTEPRVLHVARLPGDLNGDGYSEVSIGGPKLDGFGTKAGAVLTYNGKPTGVPTSPPFISDPTTQTGARFGDAVSLAGDIDGDGFADLVGGAPTHNPGGAVVGSAYVYRGSATTLGGPVYRSLDHPVPLAGARFGAVIAGGGDLNGDGLADLAIAAPDHSAPAAGAGAVYVYYGPISGSMPSVTLPSPTGEPGAKFGFSLSLAGDVDADGYSDLVVGAPHADNGQTDEGNVYLYFGGPTGLNTTPQVLDSPDGQGGEAFGFAVTGASDLNGDGFADIVAGAPRYNPGTSGAGRVYLIPGGPLGPVVSSPTVLTGTVQTDGHFGSSLTGGGDLNGDGIHDLLVGADGVVLAGTQGGVYLFVGSTGALQTTPTTTFFATPMDLNANFGKSLAMLDTNGDGFADLLAGAPNMNDQFIDDGFVNWLNGADLPSAIAYDMQPTAPLPGAEFGFALPSY